MTRRQDAAAPAGPPPADPAAAGSPGQAVEVHGTVAEGFEPVREAFARNFTARGERGAAVAVYRDGRKVVDLWGGTRDVDGTEPWRHDTAQIVRSATKGVAAAVILLLAQRGLLDLDAPVAAYWPATRRAARSTPGCGTCSRTGRACRPWTARSPPPRPPTPTSPRRPSRRRHRPGSRGPTTATTPTRTAG